MIDFKRTAALLFIPEPLQAGGHPAGSSAWALRTACQPGRRSLRDQDQAVEPSPPVSGARQARNGLLVDAALSCYYRCGR